MQNFGWLYGVLLGLGISLNAQALLPISMQGIREGLDFYVDDYQDIYIYKKDAFSFTKYNRQGDLLAETMEVYPFKIQQIQNPFNIVLFSETQQKIKFLDQNLVEIQTAMWPSTLGYMVGAYVENLQVVWLLDRNNSTLFQYNYRDQKVLNTYLLDLNIDAIKDFLVLDSKFYMLNASDFVVYDLINGKYTSVEVLGGKKISRNEREVFILAQNKIYQYEAEHVKEIFSPPNASYVEKNTNLYLAVIDNKVYLYSSNQNRN